MADHPHRAAIDKLERDGADSFVEQYYQTHGQKHTSGGNRPNTAGFKNTMEMHARWHKTHDRLLAKLECRRLAKELSN